jgi:mannose-6-phosphate isomerase-like protein (cupin superfamily)
MSEQYIINLDVKFGSLERIDVPALAAACKEQWFNQTLCQVNESVIRLGIMQGEFHWHKHDQEDEFFFVLEGRFVIDLEGQTITLEPHQGFTIPRGVLHRTRAPERAVILMVERNSINPTGDAAASLTD